MEFYKFTKKTFWPEGDAGRKFSIRFIKERDQLPGSIKMLTTFHANLSTTSCVKILIRFYSDGGTREKISVPQKN